MDKIKRKLSIPPIINKYKFVFLLFIFVLIFFWKVLLYPDYILYSETSDIIEQEMFWNYFSHVSFWEFSELPIWDPNIFSGRPFFGYYVPTFFNLSKLPFLFFPIEPLFGYLFILYYFLAALFMYLFLRLIKLDQFSSFVGAIVYVFSGRLVGYIYNGHSTIYSTVIAVPLVLIFFELFMQKQRFLYAILTAAILSFQFYGAHAQLFFFNVFFLLVYFFYNTIILIKEKQNKKVFKSILFLFTVAIFTFLFSAAQLFPFLELASHSTRSGIDYDYASLNSLPPRNLITFFFPNFFGSILDDTYWGNYHYFSLYVYVGLLPLILVVFSIFKRNKYTNFFLGFAIFSLLYALGKYFLVHPIFYNLIPGFNLFRMPERILYFLNFSMAVLSGFGVSFLLKRNIKKIKRVSKVLIVVAIVSLLALTIFYFLKPIILPLGMDLLSAKYTSSEVIDALKPLDYYAGKIALVYNGLLISLIVFSSLLVLIVLLFIFFIKNKIRKTHFKAGIALIILIDLFYFGLPYIDVKDPKEIFNKNDVISFIEHDKSRYRVLDLTLEKAVPQHLAIRYGIQKVLGYDAIILKRYDEYMAAMGEFKPGPSTTIPIKNIVHPKMLDLLNVKYIISDKNLQDDKDYKLVYNKDHSIYLNQNYLPRSFIVRKAIIKKEYEVLEEIRKQEFNPKEHIILEKSFKNLYGEGSFKEVPITYYSPNKIIAEVFLDEPGFLVLSAYWYPGWKAYDNGREIEILRANYILRSVYLDTGSHEVIFKYEPKSYKLGKQISLVTFIIVILLSIVLRKIRHNH
tara:strand:+ start:3790 stop:6174 length:2385 start_codon:yes stop_codon:yes gene_type:complete